MAKETKNAEPVSDIHNKDIKVASSTFSGRNENCLYLECPIELGQDIQKKLKIVDLTREEIQKVMVEGMCAKAGIPTKESYFDRWHYKPKKAKAEKKVELVAPAMVSVGQVQQAVVADKASIESFIKAIQAMIDKKVSAGTPVEAEKLTAYITKNVPAKLQAEVTSGLKVEVATPTLPEL